MSQTNNNSNITICFIGDLMLGRDYGDSNTFDSKFVTGDKTSIYGKDLLEKYLEGSDLLVGNLETTITNTNDKYPKTFNYRIKEENMEYVKLNDNQFMCIANNHILDYREQGMYDTINNLGKMGIKYSGAGKNIQDAMKYATFNIKDKKIGILGCADHYDYWAAGVDRAGIFFVNYNDYSELEKYVKSIKQNVDLLILSIHWGPNYQKGIETIYRKFARVMLKAGVDIIHGHSSHHVKCIRYNGKKMIMYGLGDFIDDYAVDPEYRNDLGMVVKVIVGQNNKLNVSIIPTQIEDRKVEIIVDKDQGQKVMEMIHNDCMYR